MSAIEPEPVPAAQIMCRSSASHPGHFWYAGTGPARWCTGVQVVRWFNALAGEQLEQQGHDRAAQQ